MMKTVAKIGQFLLSLLIILLLAELGCRAVLYQTRGEEKFALAAVIRGAQQKVSFWKAQKRIRDLNLPEGIYETLFSPEGEALLHEFEREYEKEFAVLVDQARTIGSRLLLLYVPSYRAKSEDVMNLVSRDTCRRFFAEMAERQEVDFLDLTEEFTKYPADRVSLLPIDGHLSRLGNQLIAEGLEHYIGRHADWRATHCFAERPATFGDLRPNDDSVWKTLRPSLAFHVKTNSQGLRMDHDLVFPKTKPRVLILGDSYAFGLYMPNHDTFPGLLAAALPDWEIVNAGVPAYTITDKVSLFVDKAKYVEPDITVLQVLDNDIYELFSFKRWIAGREQRQAEPSEAEREFMQRLRARATEN
jgi:lysophospholipase L1-like esterase